MTRAKLAALAVFILAVTGIVAAQSVRVYPGAAKFTPPDTEETRAVLKALPPGTHVSYYLTSDSFEKVEAFYKGIAKEYTMPGAPKARKLPGGQEVKQVFFIFDGAKDIVVSKTWVAVQRPYIGSITMKGMAPEYHDVRDVTSIEVVQKK